MIRFITDENEKKSIARAILEALPEWFEVEESREQYIRECVDWPFWAACEEEKPVGFLCLKQTGDATMELAVMGVLKTCHRKGYGRRLFAAAKDYAVQQGFSFIQVKTVKEGMYEDYDITNAFYKSLGFKEMEVIESVWDEATDTVTYDSGKGITVTIHYDEDTEKNTAVVKQNGKVVAESSSMTIRPLMVDESNEDYLPFGWWVIMMSNSGIDADGDIYYEDTGFLITDRDGNIVCREDQGSSYSLSQIDENFYVLYDWNSGKYIIRDYSGRELFSWIRPETYEFW